MSITRDQFDAHQRRHGFAPAAVSAPLITDAERATAARVEHRAEREIHTQIIDELNRRGVKFIHAAMNKRSTLPEGHPDFAVYVPERQLGAYRGNQSAFVWFVEVKTVTGKLSAVQETYIADLQAQGFCVSVLRSFEQFRTELNKFQRAADE